MSRNRGKGNKSTEQRMITLLTENEITGWRLNVTDIPGKPDFVFDEKRVILFVDGCFWHGCPVCKNIPATNTEFWLSKITKTQNRDTEVNAILLNEGWTVIRIWEHELKKKNIEATTKKLLKL